MLAEFALKGDEVVVLTALDHLVHTENVDHEVQGLVQTLHLAHEVIFLPVLNKDDNRCEYYPRHYKESER